MSSLSYNMVKSLAAPADCPYSWLASLPQALQTDSLTTTHHSLESGNYLIDGRPIKWNTEISKIVDEFSFSEQMMLMTHIVELCWIPDIEILFQE